MKLAIGLPRLRVKSGRFLKGVIGDKIATLLVVLGLLLAGCRPLPPIGADRQPGPKRSKTAVNKSKNHSPSVPREVSYKDKTPQQWTELLAHPNPQVRRKAIYCLAQYGRQSVPCLIELLKNGAKDPARTAAVRALGEIGSAAAEAVPVLLGQLKDNSWEGRDAVCDTLGRLGQPTEAVLQALISTLTGDPDGHVRATAARALGKLRVARPAVVSALARALEDGDTNVQMEAAEALGRLGPAARAAKPALERAAQSSNYLVAQSAQAALQAIDGG